MLADFLNTLLQFFEYLWPLKVIRPWERGLYIVCGRVVTPWRWVAFSFRPLPSAELPPGLYLAFPFFVDVHQVGIAWDFVKSGRLDLTIKDGSTLSCAAVAKMKVVDCALAYLSYHDYDIDRVAMLQATVSEILVEAEPEKFSPEKRGKLLGKSLLKEVREAAAKMGMEVESVQVTTFILHSRTLRLLSDVGSAAGT